MPSHTQAARISSQSGSVGFLQRRQNLRLSDAPFAHALNGVLIERHLALSENVGGNRLNDSHSVLLCEAFE